MEYLPITTVNDTHSYVSYTSFFTSSYKVYIMLPINGLYYFGVDYISVNVPLTVDYCPSVLSPNNSTHCYGTTIVYLTRSETSLSSAWRMERIVLIPVMTQWQRNVPSIIKIPTQPTFIVWPVQLLVCVLKLICTLVCFNQIDAWLYRFVTKPVGIISNWYLHVRCWSKDRLSTHRCLSTIRTLFV